MKKMSDVSLKDVYEITNRIEDKLDKISDRVSTLEQFKAQAIAIIGVATLAINLVWELIKDKFMRG